MKKKFMKALCVLLVTTFAVGCSSGGNTAPGESASGAGGKAEKLSVMVWDRGTSAPGTTADENTLTDYIQERVLEELNIDVEFVAVPRSNADDKINVMMAGGSAPDVIMTYSRNMVLDYAEKGGLVDLAPYLEEHGQNITTNLGDVQYVGEVAGGQFALIQKAETTAEGQTKSVYTSFIRKDWLDALGLPVPTTKDELIETLYAFQTNDPGNVGDKLVPWAMGGNAKGFKYYEPFVTSYATSWDDEAKTVYNGKQKGIQPGTEEGYKKLNELYNDGIISKDFPVDTNDDKFKQDIMNGYVGFFTEDSERPINQDYLATLKQNVPTAEFVAVNVFESVDGEYRQPAEGKNKRYVMVPATSEKNATTAVKFLNWMSDTENAVNIAFSPEHTVTESGAYVQPTQEERDTKGYPSTLSDYNFLNSAYKEITKESKVAFYTAQWPALSEDFYNNFYDVSTIGLYFEPIATKIIESEAKYGSNIESLLVEFAYNVITAKEADFETVYAAQQAKLDEAGLQAILTERQEYFNSTQQ